MLLHAQLLLPPLQQAGSSLAIFFFCCAFLRPACRYTGDCTHLSIGQENLVRGSIRLVTGLASTSIDYHKLDFAFQSTIKISEEDFLAA